MKYTLRDYQQEMVDIGVKHLKANNGKPGVLVAATGAGKSLVIAGIARQLNEPTLILQPSVELLTQNKEKMDSYGIKDIGVYSASAGKKEMGQYVMATIGSIYKKPELFKGFRHVIMDECFVAGTTVDGRPIESIKTGEMVLSYNHQLQRTEASRVMATRSMPNHQDLYCIGVDGEVIISTPNHPYYVKGKGYVEAKNITIGDIAYATDPIQPHALYPLWSNRRQSNQTPKVAVPKKGDTLSPSLPNDWSSPEVIYQNDGKQSHAQSRNQSQDVRNPQEDWSQATNTGREWPRANRTAKNAVGRIREWLVSRVGRKNGENPSRGVSTSLQGRPSQPPHNDSGRDRWRKSLQSENPRPEKATTLREVRVESVAVLKSGSDEWRKAGGQTVYNLEVEGNNNYYAHNILVHNCHLLDPKNGEGMLTSFLKAINCQSIIGLTATPYRIVQKYYTDEWGQVWYTAHLAMINRIPPFFWKNILYKVETKELINRGYLVPIKYYVDHPDTAGLIVNSTGRDYTEKSLKSWGDRKVSRIIDALLYADKNHTRSLVFCSSLQQAGRVLKWAEELNLNVGLVTSETPAKERLETVTAYKAGQLKHLLNVGVFTTGFDVPSLDCIIMARPTLSLGLWYQIVGRGVRIDPNNPHKELSVYDLAGVIDSLGRVEEITVQKESGGYRDEVWSDGERKDGVPLFNWAVNGPGSQRGGGRK